ncbi:MAG: Heat-shock protein [Candidatus Tokpelaia sp. JSC189]|nr:MAG: Heat-shock protein [Candidatus Tokpelaia sp. JSC189]
MTRISSFSNPFLLESEDGYPPYNIERPCGAADKLRITLAVVNFEPDELNVTVEDSQLIIRGQHVDGGECQYLHRGIASCDFQRFLFWQTECRWLVLN